MTRVQRAWHLRVWLLLTPLIAALTTAALMVRAERRKVLEVVNVPACCQTRALAAGDAR